jgi:4-hydroxy-tetrahydrodipicolinate synthase
MTGRPVAPSPASGRRSGQTPLSGYAGVFSILATPFAPDGGLDEGSLRHLVDALVKAGVNGLTVLGVNGEAAKLLHKERELVVQVVMETVVGRLPVIVGTSADGTAIAVEGSRFAADVGAAGVMVAPPTFLASVPSLTRHYSTIGEAAALPIVLQDYPPVNGVTMTPRAMAELARAVPWIQTVKLEGVPTAPRVAQTLELLKEGVTVVGGLGGTYLLPELRHGASGTMTGFAYPEVLLQIVRAWQEERVEDAFAAYHRYLPLLVLESQTGVGLGLRKEVLRRRGFIEHATTREPSVPLREDTLRDLAETLERLEMAATFDHG